MPAPTNRTNNEPASTGAVIDMSKLVAIRTGVEGKYLKESYTEFFYTTGKDDKTVKDPALKALLREPSWWMVDKEGNVTIVPASAVQEYYFAPAK